MNKHEPIRHHYVPRFLLKPFCFEDTKIHYYDKNTETLSVKDIKNIFVEKNFYRDDINNNDDPMKLENDLARFESEISSIIRKFLKDDEIIVTTEEYEMLQMFFAVMLYRGRNMKNEFSEDVTDEFREFYSNYQEDQNFTDFWKRNLGYIVNCRSIKDVFDNPNIDDPMKLFLKRDTVELFYSYFIIVERRGNEDFLLNEAYSSKMQVGQQGGFHMALYHFYPISPKRMIIKVCNGVETAPKTATSVAWFKKEVLKKPQLIGKNQWKLSVRKIYEEEVKRINSYFFNDTLEGLVFQDKARVSIDKYAAIYKAYDDYNAYRVEQSTKKNVL